MTGRGDPFVLTDGAVAAVAVSAAAGAWLGGGPGVVAGAAVAAVALATRKPAALCLGVAVLAAGLADRAMAGLDPANPGAVSGWVTLVDDPVPLDGGGVEVTVSLDGQRLEAVAFGRAGALLGDGLAGERVAIVGARRPPPDGAPWLVPRRIVGGLSVEAVVHRLPGSAATRLANGLRRTMAAGAAHLPTTHRSLLAGVVLGDDREQPPEVTDDFRAAGLGHLLAVSGQNVAFVLAAAGPLLTRMSWRWRLPATGIVLGAFALLVRFEPSVLRAVAMAGIAAVAAAAGRPAEGGRVLALAVTALLLVDPLLVRSVGFGLSVCASAAILALAPRVQAALRGPRWLVEPLAVTLAAQAGTLPLLLATFGGVPVAAVPANLLAAPAAGPLMVWGITAGPIAGIAPDWCAAPLHLPTSALAWWLASAAAWAASLPLGEIGGGEALVLGLGLAVTIARHRLGRAGAGRVPALLAACAACSAAWHAPAVADGPAAVARSAVLWAGDGATVLAIDGPVRVAALLEGLHRAGTRCVDAVAVAGGGRSAAAAARALERRCRPVIVAPAGRAHPGWTALPAGTALSIGSLAVTAPVSGGLAVSRAPPATFTPMPPDDEQELVRLAEVALAAVRGELPAADDDDRTTRRVRTVVDAIRSAAAAGEPGPPRDTGDTGDASGRRAR